MSIDPKFVELTDDAVRINKWNGPPLRYPCVRRCRNEGQQAETYAQPKFNTHQVRHYVVFYFFMLQQI